MPTGESSRIIPGQDLDFSRPTPGAKTLEVLEQDLKNCKELLELEPDSKWTRLSMILVMQAIGDDEKYHGEILESLKQLKTVDPCRKCYYDVRKTALIFTRHSVYLTYK